MTTTQTAKPKRQRTLVGKVVSNKMDKTIVVMVERRVKHPVLGKIIMRSAKYKAHDETNQFNEGDTVEIAEGRPISRSKSWTATKLLEAARIMLLAKQCRKKASSFSALFYLGPCSFGVVL